MTQDGLILWLGFGVGFLAVANVFQVAFWSWQVQKLVNKLMSKDFHSYQVSKQPFVPPKPLVGEPIEQEDLRPLQDFGA